MKNIVIVVFFISLIACKEVTNKTEPICECKNLVGGKSFPEIVSGFLYFPKGDSKLYKVKTLKEYKSLALGTDFLLCTDSKFIKQIEDRIQTDSSLIRFTADFLIDAPCGIVKQPNAIAEPFPVIRILSLE